MPSGKITMQVDGLKELEEALLELPKATAKNTIRRALIAAAQPIIETATSLIRVKRIRPAIVATKIKFTSGDAGKRAFAEAMARGATREEAGEAAHMANASNGDEASTSGVMSVGPSRAAFYGFEYGTIRQAPQPFMRPAWDAHKLQAAEDIKTLLAIEIEKARQRIARKTARLMGNKT